jgi:outer membrane PBP1 activator LpoA protein
VPVRVALLVPQSGDAALAPSLEGVVRMALIDLGPVRVDRRVYDTGVQTDRAARQAVAAVNDGAQINLGPVFADSVRAVRSAVGSSGVTVLAFWNNPTMAGGNVQAGMWFTKLWIWMTSGLKARRRRMHCATYSAR